MYAAFSRERLIDTLDYCFPAAGKAGDIFLFRRQYMFTFQFEDNVYMVRINYIIINRDNKPRIHKVISWSNVMTDGMRIPVLEEIRLEALSPEEREDFQHSHAVAELINCPEG
jgi:hypothetical protein